jgi:cytochrome c5
MGMRRPALCSVIVLIAIIVVAPAMSREEAVAQVKTDTQATEPRPAPQKVVPQRGERVFADNCARCHKPPMTIPPRITGTVVMHMRVRAKLSREDEQALLRYLAP